MKNPAMPARTHKTTTNRLITPQCKPFAKAVSDLPKQTAQARTGVAWAAAHRAAQLKPRRGILLFIGN